MKPGVRRNVLQHHRGQCLFPAAEKFLLTIDDRLRDPEHRGVTLLHTADKNFRLGCFFAPGRFRRAFLGRRTGQFRELRADAEGWS